MSSVKATGKKGAMSAKVPPGIKRELKKRAPRCFLCKWILADLRKNGRLTGEPLDYNAQKLFPVEGKVAHLGLENVSADDVKALTG